MAPGALSRAGHRIADLATDPAGGVHAVFLYDVDGDRRGDRVLYARSDGSGWSAPQPLDDTPGRSEGAQVAVDGGGRVHVLWYESRDPARPERLTDVVHRAWSGGRWSDPATLYREESRQGIRDPYLALTGDARGGLHLLHARSDRGFGYRVWRGEAWNSERDFDRGGAYVQWNAAPRDALDFVYVAAEVVPGERGATNDVWYRETGREPVRVYGGEGYSFEPRLATDRSGVRHVVWREGTSRRRSGRLLHATSADGRTWSPARDVTPAHRGGNLYALRLAADGSGVIHLTFARFPEGPGNPVHYHLRLGPGGWSAAVPLLPETTLPEGGPETAADPAGGIHAVWKGGDGVYRHAVLRR